MDTFDLRIHSEPPTAIYSITPTTSTNTYAPGPTRSSSLTPSPSLPSPVAARCQRWRPLLLLLRPKANAPPDAAGGTPTDDAPRPCRCHRSDEGICGMPWEWTVRSSNSRSVGWIGQSNQSDRVVDFKTRTLPAQASSTAPRPGTGRAARAAPAGAPLAATLSRLPAASGVLCKLF